MSPEEMAVKLVELMSEVDRVRAERDGWKQIASDKQYEADHWRNNCKHVEIARGEQTETYWEVRWQRDGQRHVEKYWSREQAKSEWHKVRGSWVGTSNTRCVKVTRFRKPVAP